jgi:hypothetical protein
MRLGGNGATNTRLSLHNTAMLACIVGLRMAAVCVSKQGWLIVATVLLCAVQVVPDASSYKHGDSDVVHVQIPIMEK